MFLKKEHVILFYKLNWSLKWTNFFFEPTDRVGFRQYKPRPTPLNLFGNRPVKMYFYDQNTHEINRNIAYEKKILVRNLQYSHNATSRQLFNGIFNSILLLSDGFKIITTNDK